MLKQNDIKTPYEPPHTTKLKRIHTQKKHMEAMRGWGDDRWMRDRQENLVQRMDKD